MEFIRVIEVYAFNIMFHSFLSPKQSLLLNCCLWCWLQCWVFHWYVCQGAYKWQQD